MTTAQTSSRTMWSTARFLPARGPGRAPRPGDAQQRTTHRPNVSPTRLRRSRVAGPGAGNAGRSSMSTTRWEGYSPSTAKSLLVELGHLALDGLAALGVEVGLRLAQGRGRHVLAAG